MINCNFASLKPLVIATVVLVISFIAGITRYMTGSWVPFSFSGTRHGHPSFHVNNIEEAIEQIKWLTINNSLTILYCDDHHNARRNKDSTHTRLVVCLEDEQRGQFVELDTYYLNLKIAEDGNGGFYIKDLGADIATYHSIWGVWLEE